MTLLDFLAREHASKSTWVSLANCAGVNPDEFFPTKKGDGREARRICRGCEVRAECLEYALERHEVGIWGGTDDRERRAIRRERRRQGR